MAASSKYLNFPKEESLFNCANAIESLKCFQCINFETCELVDLKQHLKAGHAPPKSEKKLHACRVCKFETRSTLLYLRHKLNLCMKRSEIKTEFQPEDGLAYFHCGDCLFRTRSKPALNYHVKKKHKPKWHECEQCPYTTVIKCHLKSHIWARHTSHDDIQWFRCEHCPHKSKRKSDLKSHVICMHGNRAKLRCDHCRFETKFKNSLRTHIVVQHTEPNQIQWHHCEQCSYKCRTRSNLKHHMDHKHAEEAKFSCDLCRYKTVTKSNLKSHMDYQHGNRAILKCDHCQFATKYKQALRTHVLVKHTDPDQISYFECPHCSYRSKLKSNLMKHVEYKHMNDPKFKCDVCQYETKFKQRLKSHVLLKHTDPDKIQWFECDQCPYKGKMKLNLERHVVNKHGAESKFQCDRCRFKGTSKKGLEAHVVIKHTCIRNKPNGYE